MIPEDIFRVSVSGLKFFLPEDSKCSYALRKLLSNSYVWHLKNAPSSTASVVRSRVIARIQGLLNIRSLRPPIFGKYAWMTNHHELKNVSEGTSSSCMIRRQSLVLSLIQKSIWAMILSIDVSASSANDWRFIL